MRNERGEVKLITIIGIILVLIVVLFGVVVFHRINEEVEGNTITTNTAKEENAIFVNNTDEEPVISTDTKMDDFSMKFLQMENNQENMIYSPLSIKYALKMLQEGASGNTYDQINKVVGNLNLPTYKNIDKNLSLANGLYVRDTYSPYVKEEYKNTLINKYNAEVVFDPFKDATNVNTWIENKTLGIIKNMLKDGEVQDPNSQMLLINALAIDMEWQSNFDCSNTYGNTFYKQDGGEMIATMMNKETSSDDVSYYIDDKVTALTMDLKKYEDTQLEFMAIMPDSNLKEYVDSLKTEDIDNITKKLTPASKTKAGVDIQIPKFKFDYDLQLKNDLINMGITDAFNKSLADFSNMVQESKVYVSDALHKADIEFSEDGIKAAAVTIFMMKDNAIAIKEQPISININKPFLFLIRDKETKEVWFTGTVYEPNSWENDKEEYQGDFGY